MCPMCCKFKSTRLVKNHYITNSFFEGVILFLNKKIIKTQWAIYIDGKDPFREETALFLFGAKAEINFLLFS